jgi:hypothetical protein
MKKILLILAIILLISCTPVHLIRESDVPTPVEFLEAEAYFDSLDARRVSIENLILTNKTFYYGKTYDPNGSEACKSNSQREGR